MSIPERRPAAPPEWREGYAAAVRDALWIVESAAGLDSSGVHVRDLIRQRLFSLIEPETRAA